MSSWESSGTPFVRPPWQEANPSGRFPVPSKSKHNCNDFFLC